MRYRAIVIASAIAAPLLRTTTIVRSRLATRIETAREIVTYHFLDVVTRHGVVFDPVVRVEGIEWFDAALAKGKGVLIVSPHAMLITSRLRNLYERDVDAAVISPSEIMIPGTKRRARVIEPSFTFLLEVRRTLRGNGVVCAMIDRDVATSKTAFEVMTDQGPLVAVDAMIRLAARAGASVVFMTARISGGAIVVIHEAPSATEATSPEGVTASFAAFLRRHVAGVASR
jgi:lauroyl/myristoyl acyltransferase